jgi:hypothetical protein
MGARIGILASAAACFDSVEEDAAVSPPFVVVLVVVEAPAASVAAGEAAVALPEASAGTATAVVADVDGCVQARRALVVKADGAPLGWPAGVEEEAAVVVVVIAVAVDMAATTGLRFRLVGRLRWTETEAAVAVVGPSAVSALGLSMTKAIVSPLRTAAPGRTFQQKSL